MVHGFGATTHHQGPRVVGGIQHVGVDGNINSINVNINGVSAGVGASNGCITTYGFFTFVFSLVGGVLMFICASDGDLTFNNWDETYSPYPPINTYIYFGTTKYTDDVFDSTGTTYSECVDLLDSLSDDVLNDNVLGYNCRKLEFCSECKDVGDSAAGAFIGAGVMSLLSFFVFLILYCCSDHTFKNKMIAGLVPHALKTAMLVLAAILAISAVSTFAPCLSSINEFTENCGDDDDWFSNEDPALVGISTAGMVIIILNAVLSAGMLFKAKSDISAQTVLQNKNERQLETERLERRQEMQGQAYAHSSSPSAPPMSTSDTAKDAYYGSSDQPPKYTSKFG